MTHVHVWLPIVHQCIMYKSSFEQHTCLLNNQLFWRFHCRILEYSKNVEFWNFQHFSTNNIISVEAAKVLPGIRLKIICWKFRGEFWKQVLRILQKYCLAVFFPCLLLGPHSSLSQNRWMMPRHILFGLMLCLFGACYTLIKGKHGPNRIKANMALVPIISPKCALKDPKCVWAAPDTSLNGQTNRQGKKEAGSAFVLFSLLVSCKVGKF
jgi:hypothetical protein